MATYFFNKKLMTYFSLNLLHDKTKKVERRRRRRRKRRQQKIILFFFFVCFFITTFWKKVWCRKIVVSTKQQNCTSYLIYFQKRNVQIIHQKTITVKGYKFFFLFFFFFFFLVICAFVNLSTAVNTSSFC